MGKKVSTSPAQGIGKTILRIWLDLLVLPGTHDVDHDTIPSGSDATVKLPASAKKTLAKTGSDSPLAIF